MVWDTCRWCFCALVIVWTVVHIFHMLNTL